MEQRSRLISAVSIAAVIYASLFVGHIVAAANGLTLLFRTITVSITLMTFLMGPIVWFLSQRGDDSNNIAYQIGFWASVPLSVGLAYAYADQTFDAAYSIGFLATTVLTHWLALCGRSVFIEPKVG
jgi:hypothetical protein